MRNVYCSDNLVILREMEDSTVDLIYIDPPFNTGKVREYQGNSYNDRYLDYISTIESRLREAHRVLKENGSIFVHLDYREVHYVKVLMDTIFGRSNFMNEIIWSYDYGARSKKRWSSKHDNILWYVMDKNNYTYNYDAIDRIPYMTPKLVGPEKAARGKTPTDVWWSTIVHTTGKERAGYPTQKPLSILERIVKVHSNEGDLLMDFYAGSGSFGVAAKKNKRRYILIDNNPEAIEIIRRRLQEI